MAAGPDACPPPSRIGGGIIRVITGFGSPFDPLDSPTPVFNNGRGWLEVSQDPSTDQTIAVTRLKVEGSRISGDIGAAPGGPPDGQSAVRSVNLTFPLATSYVMTPRACPAGGRWVTTGTFGFADGTTQVAHGDTPCVRAKAPRIGVRVRPARVRVGKRVRIRVTIRSAARRCVSHARVRLRGRPAKRTGARGRTTIVARLRHAGRRVVVASKRGCRRGTRSLTVVRARRR
jgi:hypothetical protein